MTKKLFWSDSYLTSCDTFVQSACGDVVILCETIFYAFAGGQESDAGTIADYPVLEAKTVDLDVHYRLPVNHQLKPGDGVQVKIDWDRRYRLMRLHFAAEIVLELAYRSLPGIEKIGAHIAADKARLDFNWPESLSPYLPHLAAAAQKIVDRDIEVFSAYSDKITQRRYWQLAGFGRVPCGGTHLRRTAEVGALSLKRKNIGKDKERIEVYASLPGLPV